ncbi:MAG: SpoIIE family protein phosphatase [Oscillospiraceae bacterium]|nr:SpoIIE family protein phosphatase [Oscillospiraceae bacterium]
MKNAEKTISSTFLKWMVILMSVAFLFSAAFSWSIQTRLANRSAESLLRLNIMDVRKDVLDASDENLLGLTHKIAGHLDREKSITQGYLLELMRRYKVAEINVIDPDGIITVTTHDDFLNYDMHSGEQSAEFLPLLDGTMIEHVQKYQPTTHDPSLSRKYGAVCLKRGGFVEVGYDAERFQKDIDDNVIGVTKNRHVGEGGCIIIADEDWNIVSDRNNNEGENLFVTGIWIDQETMPEGELFRSEVYGEQCSCMYVFTEGYYIVAVMPENEVVLERNTSIFLDFIGDILIFVALAIVIFLLVRYLVLNNIKQVNRSLARITEGNLDEVVDVRSNIEFSSLSDGINATVSTLKEYIAAAAARIDEELAFAKNIQQSALPSVFPPYPDRKDFSLYATMHTAREVGGDFYDFDLLDERKLSFLVADVSGKGIPAAMFMMTGKTVLRDYAERGDEPEDVVRNANRKLCDGNDAEMFITAWIGFLDTATGQLRFVNAGHNPPVLIRSGQAAFLDQESNMVLAVFDTFPYCEQVFQLEPGDLLYLYTDGVTEATNTARELFGNDRLIHALSDSFGEGETACKSVCATVKRKVDEFADGAPQFDDITMLCLYYGGQNHPAAES